MWNIFKVSNKDTRTTSMALWWYLFLNFEDISHLLLVFCYFEHVCLLSFKLSDRSCYLSCNRSNYIFKVNTRNNDEMCFNLKLLMVAIFYSISVGIHFQSQHWKHQDNVCNLFKVKIKTPEWRQWHFLLQCYWRRTIIC